MTTQPLTRAEALLIALEVAGLRERIATTGFFRAWRILRRTPLYLLAEMERTYR